MPFLGFLPSAAFVAPSAGKGISLAALRASLPAVVGSTIGGVAGVLSDLIFPAPTVDEDSFIRRQRQTYLEQSRDYAARVERQIDSGGTVIVPPIYPFRGGQSAGVSYTLTVRDRYHANNPNYDYTFTTNRMGKIIGVVTVIGGAHPITNQAGAGNPYQNWIIFNNGNSAFATSGSGSLSGTPAPTTQIVSVVRADGQPDTGGDPPPTTAGVSSQAGNLIGTLPLEAFVPSPLIPLAPPPRFPSPIPLPERETEPSKVPFSPFVPQPGLEPATPSEERRYGRDRHGRYEPDTLPAPSEIPEPYRPYSPSPLIEVPLQPPLQPPLRPDIPPAESPVPETSPAIPGSTPVSERTPPLLRLPSSPGIIIPELPIPDPPAQPAPDLDIPIPIRPECLQINLCLDERESRKSEESEEPKKVIKRFVKIVQTGYSSSQSVLYDSSPAGSIYQGAAFHFLKDGCAYGSDIKLSRSLTILEFPKEADGYHVTSLRGATYSVTTFTEEV